MNTNIDQTVRLLTGDQPVVMGVLNVTPDSFSDGGCFNNVDQAVAHAHHMQQQGADIIDIGGESTRPGAEPVTAEQELERVLPVIEAIRAESNIPISIDTTKPEVMRAAVAAGATMVNDVNALRADGAIECCVQLDVPVCLMHMQGQPRTMQHNPEYTDVVDDVGLFLHQRIQDCIEAGMDPARICLDPGFGFGKTVQHNLALLQGLDRICALKFPVLVGFSRKSMFGALLGRDVERRLAGSLAALVLAFERGARWFRVHDVAESKDALEVCTAVKAVNS